MRDGAEWTRWGLLGRSEAMSDLRGEILKYGARSWSVHVHGETGTGKELVAQALHTVSRRPGPCVPFNAAGFPDDLLVTELFGHTRGAFTGAVAAREGDVAAAERGTLFLDEIAELSLEGQGKLLRFLEHGEYRRLGETTPRRADVRVVSATNVDLAQRVAQGRFREDLLYRLVRHRISLPPLRDRGGDVLLLLHHFMQEQADPQEKSPRLSPEAERALLRFRWPGNVRQLASEAGHLLVNAVDGFADVCSLSDEVREGTATNGGPLQEAKDEFERHFIRRALARNGGNRTATARELGISRQALVAKIRRLEILDSGRCPKEPDVVASAGSRGRR